MTGAKKWWYNKIDTVRAYIHNFGGFLLKADSEGEPGPVSTYGETESEGANPIAQALGRYGYALIWRTFVYSSSASSDFAEYQSQQFINQTWDSSVVMRSKDGPRDFQMIEPVNQLFQMGGVRHGMEVEVDHEYTGQAIPCRLALSPVAAGPAVEQRRGFPVGWSGGSANSPDPAGCRQNNRGNVGNRQYKRYGELDRPLPSSGRSLRLSSLTWNPMQNEDSVADDWVRSSFPTGYNPGILYVTKHILERSWKTTPNTPSGTVPLCRHWETAIIT